MAVKSSGSLSLTTDIVGEFGGSAPHSLSEYYGGAGLVPAGANPGVATSGTINMNSFYGTVSATVLTISSNTNNYDIGSAVISAGGDKNTPVILTINSGVTVGSTSSTNPAMKTGTGWGSGVTINIINNGSIVGASGSNSSSQKGGGNGGGGGMYSNNAGYGSAGVSGSGSADSSNNGGNAFEHSQTGDNNLSVIFDTAGTRTGGSAGTKTFYGGGGGGGGGGAGEQCGCYSCNFGRGGGGGGGQGTPGGSSGVHNGAQNGSSSSYGNGGGGGSHGAGAGGRGGSLGQAGVSGNNGNPSGSFHGRSGGAGGSNGSANGSAGSALSGNTGQIS